MRLLARYAVLAMATAAVPFAVQAQEQAQERVAGPNLNTYASQSMFARDRNVSVRERPRPAYQAMGVRLGSFWAYPKIETDVEYNNNIFAVTTGPTSDTIFRVKPEVMVQSGWSRHSLSLYGRGSFNRFVSNSSEDTNEWDFGSDGRIDVVRGSDVKLGGEASRITEPRTAAGTPAAAAKPVQYLLGQGYIVAEREVDRIKLSARGDIHRYNYLSVPSLAGGIVDENDRDRTTYDYIGRVDYALSPDTAIFVELGGNTRNYRLPGTVRLPIKDSTGYQALGGVTFDLTNLVRGEIGAGYLSQSFKSSAYGRQAGLGLRAKVEWFPTQLTTVTGTASRSVEDSGIVGSGGYVSTALTGQIDHELLRNVLISANVGYTNDSYNGVAREDRIYTAGASATYLLNRRVGVNVGYAYYRQTSTGAAAGAKFNVGRVMAGLVLQY